MAMPYGGYGGGEGAGAPATAWAYGPDQSWPGLTPEARRRLLAGIRSEPLPAGAAPPGVAPAPAVAGEPPAAGEPVPTWGGAPPMAPAGPPVAPPPIPPADWSKFEAAMGTPAPAAPWVPATPQQAAAPEGYVPAGKFEPAALEKQFQDFWAARGKKQFSEAIPINLLRGGLQSHITAGWGGGEHAGHINQDDIDRMLGQARDADRNEALRDFLALGAPAAARADQDLKRWLGSLDSQTKLGVANVMSRGGAVQGIIQSANALPPGTPAEVRQSHINSLASLARDFSETNKAHLVGPQGPGPGAAPPGGTAIPGGAPPAPATPPPTTAEATRAHEKNLKMLAVLQAAGLTPPVEGSKVANFDANKLARGLAENKGLLDDPVAGKLLLDSMRQGGGGYSPEALKEMASRAFISRMDWADPSAKARLVDGLHYSEPSGGLLRSAPTLTTPEGQPIYKGSEVTLPLGGWLSGHKTLLPYMGATSRTQAASERKALGELLRRLAGGG
jgi:hypothetical protein